AVSQAIALSDSAGEPVSAAPVVVPSPTHTPAAVATADPAPTPVAPPSAAPTEKTESEVQVVPAPAPRDVTLSEPSNQPAAPRSTPSAATTTTQDALLRELRAVLAQYQKDHDSKKVVAWLAAHKSQWALLEEYVRAHADEFAGLLPPNATPVAFGLSQTSAVADTSSGRVLPGSSAGSKREGSRITPDRRD
ncbi:MAG: hypothetical protein QM675_12635, partial [Protaetiibacter sp.]